MKFNKFNQSTLKINKCEGIHISTCMLSNKTNLLSRMLAQPLPKSTRECSPNKMLEDNGESFTETIATWKFALNIRAPNAVANLDFNSYILSIDIFQPEDDRIKIQVRPVLASSNTIANVQKFLSCKSEQYKVAKKLSNQMRPIDLSAKEPSFNRGQ